MMPPCPRCGTPCASEQGARRHCSPARLARRTGYRTDSLRHREARFRVPAAVRRAVARLGAEARKKDA